MDIKSSFKEDSLGFLISIQISVVGWTNVSVCPLMLFWWNSQTKVQSPVWELDTAKFH